MSDHMFVSDDTAISHHLKMVFYNHSVIPALQGGEGDKRISETWSFLVFIEGQAFFIVNAMSRDSVGRRRFPLIVAYPLPQEIKLEAALEQLRELKGELLSLLNEMLESPGDDLNQWQEIVTKKAKSFKSNVNWAAVDSTEVSCQLKQDQVQSLLSRLEDDCDALDLKSCSFPEAYSFIQLGLKQFKSEPPAMLILDQEERGSGLFFATEGGTSFHLRRYLYNNLTSLAVPADNVSEKVSRLLKSANVDDKDVLSIDEVPSLKLGIHQSPLSRKLIALGVTSVLIILVLFGFYSCSSKTCPDTTGLSEKDSTQQLSSLEQWISNATAYINWIQPLTAFVDEQREAIPEFESVATILKSDLNPFAVVKAEKASMKLAKNPPDEFLSSENVAKLGIVYANIKQLKDSLTAYYEKQFSDKLIKELKRQNYPQPVFVDVDFSQQPLLPDFGPGFISQFQSYLSNREALNDVVTTTKLFWNSIIKPLHQVCPEHAKYVQKYVQNLIANSESPEQFKKKHDALLKIFGYPEFIKIDEADTSKHADCQLLLEKEQSKEALYELIELLDADNKDDPHDQTVVPGEEAVDTKALPFEAEFVEPLVLSPEEKILFSDIDLAEWDILLETSLKPFKDDRLVDEIKSHAKVIQSQILGDENLESAQALVEFKEQINSLVTAFKRLDVSSVTKSSSFQTVYMASEQRRQHLSDYMFAKYTAADIKKGNLESISKISQEISTSVDAYLAALDQSFTELETNYFLSQRNEAAVDLSKQIAAITENPLYVDGLFGSRLSILKAAAYDDGTVAIKTAEDLDWYLENLIAKGWPEKNQLAMVTAVFSTLEPVDQSSELSGLIRTAFDKYVQELRTSESIGLLRLYESLRTYLPEKLQTSEDGGFEKIAMYWSRYNSELNPAKPPRAELEKMRDSAKFPALKQFYIGLLEEYGRTSSQSSGTFLNRIETSNGVESVSVNDDQSKLEVVFEGDFGKLIFLPFETEEGTVFIQQNPLSLQQYIQLSNMCDFDTEYYLTLQDSFWPRSFEVGIGSQFSTLREWQFRNRDVFAPIDAFNRKTLPAHLNEPKAVLRMAQFFGFRLLKPKECVAFVRSADRSLANRLEFSAAEREELENFNAIQSSVYAQSIAELMEQDAWSGGIDFERGKPGENQFFDIAGGSAELAYDGTDFYALGGSWLCEPPALEKPVRIAEPSRMYMDVGVRFAVDAPTQSYNKLVQKIALQVLTDSK